MKKSEKAKGKERVVQQRDQRRKIILVAGGIIIVAVVLLFVFTNPFTAKTGDKVSVYYTGTLENGTVFDSNLNSTPMTFTLGSGAVIVGFDEAVRGMAVNEQKTVHIPVDKAYGPYNAALVHDISRSLFPANVTPVVGTIYTFTRPGSGMQNLVKVVNVTPTMVTVDENHMLAGQNLTFIIKLVSIQKASTVK